MSKYQPEPTASLQQPASAKPARVGCTVAGILGVLLVFTSVVGAWFYLEYRLLAPSSTDVPLAQLEAKPDSSVTQPTSTKKSTSSAASKNAPSSTPATPKESTKPVANSTTDEIDPTKADDPVADEVQWPADDQLEFFVDLANYDQTHKYEQKVSRWNHRTIYVGAEAGDPNYDDQYKGALARFIGDFNASSSAVKLAESSDNSNIKLNFVTTDQLHVANDGRDNLPFASVNEYTTGEVSSVDIYIPIDHFYSDNVKWWTLKHEMMHAVGFSGHTTHMKSSEMSNETPLYITKGGLSDADKRAIRMLYSSGIPIGTSLAQTRDFFATHSY